MAATRQKKTAYPVVFAESSFGEGSQQLAATLKEITGSESTRVLLVADTNVVERTEGLGSRIGRYFRANGITLAAPPVILGGGEHMKVGLDGAVKQLAAAVLDAKIGRGDVMLALGGGCVLDVAGYVAAQVRGGMKLVRMPTTPAAMIDAAFAERAAIDICGVKDALSVTSEPAAVVIDTQFAKTVFDGVWRGGLAEIVRLALSCDAKLFKALQKNAAQLKARDYDVFKQILADAVSVRLKKGSPSLALWSTLRIEAISSWKMPHGYAIALGMAIDAAYAVIKGCLAESDRQALSDLLAELGAFDGSGRGIQHLRETDDVLRGLDARKLAAGSEAIEIPCALGKCETEATVDRESMRRAIETLK